MVVRIHAHGYIQRILQYVATVTNAVIKFTYTDLTV
jgi:hypothetical protein